MRTFPVNFKECCIKATFLLLFMRVGCYTKKLPFGLQSIQSGYKGYYFHSVIDCFMDQVQKKGYKFKKDQKIRIKSNFVKNDENLIQK